MKTGQIWTLKENSEPVIIVGFEKAYGNEEVRVLDFDGCLHNIGNEKLNQSMGNIKTTQTTLSMITIALPNFAMDIAWLAMESLCRQQTQYEWELIVYEDSNAPLSEEFYNSYMPRLKDVGCVRLLYNYSKERIALSQKWLWMAEQAHKDSLGLILQASDCYSEPNRIQTATAVFKKGYHWIHSYQGCFYNIPTGQTMKYQKQKFTGINIAISIGAVCVMSKAHEQWSGVDHWLWNSMPINIIQNNKHVYLDQSDNWKGGVNTDGRNRLSINRHLHYNNPKPPFHHTYLDIYSLLPGDVCDMLDKLKQ